jgi:hypothetical protein
MHALKWFHEYVFIPISSKTDGSIVFLPFRFRLRSVEGECALWKYSSRIGYTI